LSKLGLGLGQTLGRAVADQLQPLHVEDGGAQLDLARADRLAAGAAQDGVDAQHQFARLERLGHIVVGAARQSLDPVLGIAPRGQQQDRRLRQFGLVANPCWSGPGRFRPAS
jgi:hypothetical protein